VRSVLVGDGNGAGYIVDEFKAFVGQWTCNDGFLRNGIGAFEVAEGVFAIGVGLGRRLTAENLMFGREESSGADVGVVDVLTIVFERALTSLTEGLRQKDNTQADSEEDCGDRETDDEMLFGERDIMNSQRSCGHELRVFLGREKRRLDGWWINVAHRSKSYLASA
jgi:hypothetical protein